MTSILIVDDDSQMQAALNEAVGRFGYDSYISGSAVEGIGLLREKEFSLVITDMRMPGMDGTEFIKQIRTVTASLPVLVITGFGTVENAVECMKLGASDYLMKPFSSENLREAIIRLIEENRSEGNILTEDGSMKDLLKIAHEVARTDSTVLIAGESGTGKELLARYIHENSRRRDRGFVAVNCAAIPDNLLESELFGHERGAFTGATEKKMGKFELAHQGTLLLDEIGEMPLTLQAKLLRVLQEKEIDRVGGKGPISVDLRVIATTNRDLSNEIQNGNFREDLYYRLSVIPLEIPPLRERPCDIMLLAEHFAKGYATRYGKQIHGLTDDAMRYLSSLPWKGNVRELENSIQRAVLLGRSGYIDSDDFQMERRQRTDAVIKTIREMEKDLIMKTLKLTDGNRTKAAESLGITVRTLRNKLNEYRVCAQGV